MPIAQRVARREAFGNGRWSRNISRERRPLAGNGTAEGDTNRIYYTDAPQHKVLVNNQMVFYRCGIAFHAGATYKLAQFDSPETTIAWCPLVSAR